MALIIHGTYSAWFIALLIFFFVGVNCAAMDLTPLDQLLGEAVASALISAGITVKQAVALMAIDETQFRKALKGEGYRNLSLNHLVKLPWAFWLYFGPTLMWLVAKKHATEIAETVTLRERA